MHRRNNNSDRYLTLSKKAEVKIAVGSCRFIGSAASVKGKAEAEDFINKIITKYSDASHNAFAYRVGLDEIDFKMNDDGEPSGSAGRPIMEAIRAQNLYFAVVVVSRYFGGVKQGLGGLKRAYRKCADRVLKEAGAEVKILGRKVTLKIEYDYLGRVMGLIEKYEIELLNIFYEQSVTIELLLPGSLINNIKEELLELTSGNIRINVHD